MSDQNSDSPESGQAMNNTSGGSAEKGQTPPGIKLLWLRVTNVRLKAKRKTAQVELQVEGDAGEAAERGPTWLPYYFTRNKYIGVDKVYDKVVDALQNNRKVRGLVTCGAKGLYVKEIDVRYQ